MGNARKVFKKARFKGRKAINMKSYILSSVPFDEYKAGRKTYLVFPWGTSVESAGVTAGRRFHCSQSHLHMQVGLVEDGYLYLDFITAKTKRGQRKVLVVEYTRRSLIR